MNQQKIRRNRRIRLTFTYAAMTLTTIGLVVVAIFVTLGYRYNSGSIDQGGMIQFDSRPNGATIQLDAVKLANRTGTRITATAGQHTITMSKDGYIPWQKQVNVQPGTILWLNYAKLIPVNLKYTDKIDLAGVDSAVTSLNNQYFAIIQDNQKPNISFVRVNNDTVKLENVAIDSSEISGEDAESHTFAVIEWSPDNRRVLVRHTYDDKQEYLLAGLDGKTQNITKDLGVDIKSWQFDRTDHQLLYVLNSGNELRQIKLQDKTLSGPIVSSVSNFSVSSEGWISYSTLPNQENVRTVGYVSKGATKPRTVRSFSDMNDRSLMISIDEYYHKRYMLIAYGKSVDVLQADLPASDSTNSNIVSKALSTLKLSNDAEYAQFGVGGRRFVWAQSGKNIVTYDLELQSIASVAPKNGAGNKLAWLDESHIMNVAGGVFEIADYDGTNMHTIASDAVGSTAMQTPNVQYLYYFRKHAEAERITLSYVKMFD